MTLVRLKRVLSLGTAVLSHAEFPVAIEFINIKCSFYFHDSIVQTCKRKSFAPHLPAHAMLLADTIEYHVLRYLEPSYFLIIIMPVIYITVLVRPRKAAQP